MSFDRSDVGGWISGPQIDDDSWPGKALGYPFEGPGSVASLGRRVVGFLVDWVLALVLSALLAGGNGWMNLALFWLITVVPMILTGQSLGHWLTRTHIAVVRREIPPIGQRPYWAIILIRQSLMLLVFPALLMNTDMRGMNDRLTGAIVLAK